MNINIKIPKESFYSGILSIIKTIPPLSKLRPKELDLLAEIMRQNDSLRNIERDKRKLIIFSTENRKLMQKKLGCTPNIFNNNFSILKKHRIISQSNELISSLDVNINNGFKFEITINHDGSSKL